MVGESTNTHRVFLQVTWLETDLFTVGLGFLMLSMGLTLTFEDFRRCLRNPWTVRCIICFFFFEPRHHLLLNRRIMIKCREKNEILPLNLSSCINFYPKLSISSNCTSNLECCNLNLKHDRVLQFFPLDKFSFEKSLKKVF